jgi:hypothetical protein
VVQGDDDGFPCVAVEDPLHTNAFAEIHGQLLLGIVASGPQAAQKLEGPLASACGPSVVALLLQRLRETLQTTGLLPIKVPKKVPSALEEKFVPHGKTP